MVSPPSWDFVRVMEVCHMVLFPPEEVLLWDFYRGEGLPYGIPSWGTFAIWYNFREDNLPWYLFPHHEICVGEDLP